MNKLLLVFTFLLSAGSSFVGDQSEWKTIYGKLKAEALPKFVPKKIGERVTVTTKTGDTVSGVLAGTAAHAVMLKTNAGVRSLSRKQLVPKSRPDLYAEDFAHFIALKEVKKQQAKHRKEQARLAEQEASQRAAEDRVQEEAQTATAKKQLAEAHLVLMDWHWSEKYDFVTIEGQVGNVSGHKLENVMAVAKLFAQDGSFITSGAAVIEYNPLMPGQVSPFKIMEKHNPMMHKASLEFKIMWGPTLSTINKEQYEKATKKTE